MSDLRLFVTEDEMRAARTSLGNPAGLDEVLVSTGIDAFLVLLGGGTVELSDGRRVHLSQVVASNE